MQNMFSWPISNGQNAATEGCIFVRTVLPRYSRSKPGFHHSLLLTHYGFINFMPLFSRFLHFAEFPEIQLRTAALCQFLSIFARFWVKIVFT